MRVLEARSRPGGRLWTVDHAGVLGELGGTCFGPEHRALRQLLQELEIDTVPQLSQGLVLQQTHPAFPVQAFEGSAFNPDTDRVAGGSQAIIAALLASLPNDAVHFDSPVAVITQQG